MVSRDAAPPVEVDGRVVKVTNLDKVLYPETGTTKGDVIDYYRLVAPWFVPHAAWRPATRKRWVNGVGTAAQPGHAFFHKNLEHQPDWIATATIEHSSDKARYPLINDAATLVYLAQLASIELHVPQWRYTPALEPQPPDRLILDLDPGEGAGLDHCVDVALIVKEILDGVGLVSVPVTSGSKGIHLYAGLDGVSTRGASELAKQLAVALEAAHPDLVVASMKKVLREGRVLLDWSQNNGAKTTVAPYSLRGRLRPTVAAPRTWDEIAPGLRQLEYPEVLERLNDIGDPLAVLLPDVRQPDGERADRLAPYRAKRDATRTPEPVPAGPGVGSSGRSFVIGEHHARRLHHDFRLERDGVLASWAVPKLTPLDPAVNHLAVRTEDHPLEYGAFEGTIPQGEYGAGEVTIWDAGTYDLEKWRDDEVIVVLHGRPDGGLGGVPRRYALINTGRGGDPKNWLLHLMRDASPAPTGSPPAGSPPPGSPRTRSQPSRTPAAVPLEELPTIEPMLATPGSPGELLRNVWHYEVKWDGYRSIAAVARGRLRLASRKGLDLTSDYPELAELNTLVGDHAAVIDGEIVALGPDGRSHFELLQNHGRGAASAHYMAFDLLWLDGESLLKRPYVERREALENLLSTDGRNVHVPTTFGEDRELALTTSQHLRLEGVVAKRATSTYAAGRRSRAWLKFKNVRHQDVVVVGWEPGEGSRAQGIGSLLLAVHDDAGRLAYCGRAGSGFTEQGLAEALALLRPLSRPTPPLDGVPRVDARLAHWVEPTLVGEVSFADWTAGGHLRHPVWRGWRPDVDPAGVTRE